MSSLCTTLELAYYAKDHFNANVWVCMPLMLPFINEMAIYRGTHARSSLNSAAFCLQFMCTRKNKPRVQLLQ